MSEQYSEKVSDMDINDLQIERQKLIDRMNILDKSLRGHSENYSDLVRPLKKEKMLYQEALHAVKSELSRRSKGQVVVDHEPLSDDDWNELL